METLQGCSAFNYVAAGAFASRGEHKNRKAPRLFIENMHP